jgi:hypothetical protein
LKDPSVPGGKAQTYTLNEIHADDELEAYDLRQRLVNYHFGDEASIECDYACDGDSDSHVLDENDLAGLSILQVWRSLEKVVHVPIFEQIGDSKNFDSKRR